MCPQNLNILGFEGLVNPNIKKKKKQKTDNYGTTKPIEKSNRKSRGRGPQNLDCLVVHQLK